MLEPRVAGVRAPRLVARLTPRPGVRSLSCSGTDALREAVRGGDIARTRSSSASSSSACWESRSVEAPFSVKIMPAWSVRAALASSL